MAYNLTNQSKELTAFYKAWLLWAETGKQPKHMEFSASVGLCTNLKHYSDYNYTVSRELFKQFAFAELDADCPFSNAERDYSDDAYNNTMHTNPVRLAWVKEHIPNEQA